MCELVEEERHVLRLKGVRERVPEFQRIGCSEERATDLSDEVCISIVNKSL